MKICTDCERLLSRSLSAFQGNPTHLTALSCTKREILEAHGIWYTCLELFAVHLIHDVFNKHGHEFDEIEEKE